MSYNSSELTLFIFNTSTSELFFLICGLLVELWEDSLHISTPTVTKVPMDVVEEFKIWEGKFPLNHL